MKQMSHSVRGIHPDNWKWLKSVAAFRGVPVGQLLNEIIDEWAFEGGENLELRPMSAGRVPKSRRSASARAN